MEWIALDLHHRHVEALRRTGGVDLQAAFALALGWCSEAARPEHAIPAWRRGRPVALPPVMDGLLVGAVRRALILPEGADRTLRMVAGEAGIDGRAEAIRSLLDMLARRFDVEASPAGVDPWWGLRPAEMAALEGDGAHVQP